jgi:glycosyltransferase involved in cell wall biosynthesis
VSVVVPVFNSRRFLPETVPALLNAVRHAGDAEVVFVDNGSTDGSYELLLALHDDSVRVFRREGSSIGGVRNFGARQATGDHIAFIDADCVIPAHYIGEALEALTRTGAAATGCHVQIPAEPHWIEAAWHHTHFVGRDRFVHYLNSGNFFVSRAAFEAVGGFDEELPTGEDAELGQRLVDAGHRIYECSRVEAVHLGNPKSVRQYYRRSVWHALGMFGTVGWKHLDKPTAATFAHLAASATGVWALAARSFPASLLLALALQLLVPAATVAFRAAQTRRLGHAAPTLALYWLYYWARIQALALIAAGRGTRYRK